MEESPFDPRVFLRRFHQHYVNFARLWKRFGVPDGIVLRDPAVEPVTPAPAALASAVDAILRDQGTGVRFVKHMRSVNGKPSIVVEDESDLPPVEELVVMTFTTSVVTSATHRVVTDVYVGERR
jgi:hypothetical protein